MTLAIVFPGQGSQSVGMLQDIAQEFSEVKSVFAQASDILSYDLWKIVQEGPSSELDKTEITQPALLAASYAIWQILQKYTHLQPAFLAGHSLGEYTALVCSGALSFTDAIKAVEARGKFMQAAVRQGTGAMAAIIGLEDIKVEEVCIKASLQTNALVSPANFNSPGQIVIAGHAKGVEAAITLAKGQGAKLSVLLPVSVPSHCALMEPAAEQLREYLSTLTFQSLTIPVINNVEAIPYTDQTIQTGLVKQLSQPVKWVNTIEYLIKNNVTQIIECGPGKVLTNLSKRINKNLQLFSTQDVKNLNELIHKTKVSSV